MALAIRFDELLRSGAARDLNHLAAVSNVSQPRISQILSLTMWLQSFKNCSCSCHES